MENDKYCEKVRREREDASERHAKLLRKNAEIEDKRFVFELHHKPESQVITMIIGDIHEFKEIQVDPEAVDFLISCFDRLDNQLGKQQRLRKLTDYSFKDSI